MFIPCTMVFNQGLRSHVQHNFRACSHGQLRSLGPYQLAYTNACDVTKLLLGSDPILFEICWSYTSMMDCVELPKLVMVVDRQTACLKPIVHRCHCS